MSASSVTQRREAMVGLIAPILGRMVGSQPFSLPGDLSDESRILVVDSGDLTELLFFAPVLNHLKRRFPGMRVTMLVRQGNGELIRTMEPISEMISYEPEHLALTSTTYYSLLKRLKGRGFNVVFLLGKEFSFSRSVMALLTHARLRVGYTQEFTYPFVNCEIRASSGNQYEGPRVLGFLTALGLSPGDSIMGWKLPDQDVRWANQMIHFRKPDKETMLIAVDPGIGKGNHRLVEKSFAYIVNEVGARYPSKVLLLSHNLDQKGIQRFKTHMTCDLIDLEATNVKEALALLSRADLVLSGNTDYFHFAVGMKIPTVGFFTQHDTANWFPKSTPWVQIIQGVKGQKISPDEVCSKIDTLLHLSSS